MKLHLTGIGGVGMSALAELLLDSGIEVSGSERFLDHGKALPVLDVLCLQGAHIFPQNGSGVTDDIDAVVISSAIERDNPDIAAAERKGIEVVHRSVALARALASKRIVSVAGTSGKSTITAMLGHILNETGFQPSVVNGAPCINWCSSERTGAVLKGNGDLCIVEVDESDCSLFNFNPEHALISNCSADHFCLLESNTIFNEFLTQVTGNVLDGRYEPDLPPAVRELEWGCEFSHRGRVVTLPQPGLHNATNAWQAIRMAEMLGAETDACIGAISTFKGIKRRLELVGIRDDGVRVVDEYAHNTEKIRASLKTLSARSKRVLALWRPHGYGPLAKMFADLVEMFSETLRADDVLFLLPVFDMGGTAARSINSDLLRDQLVSKGADCRLVADHKSAISSIRATACSGDVIVTMGARDPELPVTAISLLGGDVDISRRDADIGGRMSS